MQSWRRFFVHTCNIPGQQHKCDKLINRNDSQKVSKKTFKNTENPSRSSEDKDADKIQALNIKVNDYNNFHQIRCDPVACSALRHDKWRK